MEYSGNPFVSTRGVPSGGQSPGNHPRSPELDGASFRCRKAIACATRCHKCFLCYGGIPSGGCFHAANLRHFCSGASHCRRGDCRDIGLEAPERRYEPPIPTARWIGNFCSRAYSRRSLLRRPPICALTSPDVTVARSLTGASLNSCTDVTIPPQFRRSSKQVFGKLCSSTDRAVRQALRMSTLVHFAMMSIEYILLCWVLSIDCLTNCISFGHEREGAELCTRACAKRRQHVACRGLRC